MIMVLPTQQYYIKFLSKDILLIQFQNKESIIS